MKIQLALDDITIEDALVLCEEVRPYIDIIEVGTPMIIEYGVEAIRLIRKNFPEKIITADPKIMDAGEYEASQCFNAGADIVTVMGVTNNETFVGAIQASKKRGGSIMADMMAVNNIEERAKELLELGIDYITVHTAVDIQNNSNPYHDLSVLQKVVPSKNLGTAGGINTKSIDNIIKYKPEIVIVGSGITKAKSALDAAKAIKGAIREND